jgi:ankyrin repeat protein
MRICLLAIFALLRHINVAIDSSLAERGASLSLVDCYGDTALHLACKNGKFY